MKRNEIRSFTEEPPRTEAPEEKREKSVLSKIDRFVIREGLQRLKEMFKALDADELPNTIIFPDTSARLFASALTPVLSDVYAKHQRPLPIRQFLVTLRDDALKFDPITLYSEVVREEVLNQSKDGFEVVEAKRLKECEAKIAELKEILLSSDRETYRKFLGDWEKRKSEIPSLIQEARLWDQNIRVRFQRIVDRAPLGNILVVDDFLDTGNTLMQFERLRRTLDQRHTMSFFVFYNSQDQSEASKITKMSIKSGVTKDVLSRRKFPCFSFQGVGLRHRDPEDTKKQMEYNKRLKASFTGVKKPTPPAPIVQRVSLVDSSGLRRIRQEMKEIGESVATEN